MSPTQTGADPKFEELILRLVREALVASGGNVVDTNSAGSHTDATRGETSCQIGERIISLGALEGLPGGIRRLEIAPRALVTPAAADLLRERGVEVVRGDGGQPTGAGSTVTSTTTTEIPSSDASRWIADADQPGRAVGYARQLAHRGVIASNIELPSPDEHPGPARCDAVGVVVAEVAAVQVDRFARTHRLPAAAVGSLGEVQRVTAAMTPAVWVLDATRLSYAGRIAVAAECFRLAAGGSGTDPSTRRSAR